MIKKVLSVTWALLLALGLWYLLAISINSPALPQPHLAFIALTRYWPELWEHLLTSLYRVLAALGLGLVIGYPLALFTARSPHLDKIFAPLIYLLYPIPKVVFLPVLLVLLGIADAPKIALITLTLVFQVIVTERDALKNMDEDLILSAKSMGARPWQLYWHLYLPATLPTLFTALRLSTGTAVAVLFISESIAGTSGLGYYIVNSWGLLNYPQMFAGIICMAILGLVLYELIYLCEYLICIRPYRRDTV